MLANAHGIMADTRAQQENTVCVCVFQECQAKTKSYYYLTPTTLIHFISKCKNSSQARLSNNLDMDIQIFPFITTEQNNLQHFQGNLAKKTTTNKSVIVTVILLLILASSLSSSSFALTSQLWSSTALLSLPSLLSLAVKIAMTISQLIILRQKKKSSNHSRLKWIDPFSSLSRFTKSPAKSNQLFSQCVCVILTCSFSEHWNTFYGI